jgi:cell wall-associated NlpC family hydrolase
VNENSFVYFRKCDIMKFTAVMIKTHQKKERTREMKVRRKKFDKMLIAFILLACGVMCSKAGVQAATQDISVVNYEEKTVEVQVGDTGKIMVTPGTAEVIRYEYVTSDDYYYGEDDEYAVISVEQDGSYKVLASGTATVYVYGYDSWDETVFRAEVTFQATIDMTDVTLAQTAIVGYMMASYDGEGKAYYYGANASVDINSPVAIPDGTEVDVTSSSSKYSVIASIAENRVDLSISGSKSGSTTLTITIEGKAFTVKLQMKKVGISKTTLLIGKKKSQTLKITGYSGEVTWTSKNSKIATVSKNGKVTGKKYGNTVVIAKVGDQYLGCAVSVVTPKLVKVCARAEYIGRHWKYSQAKRTQTGYYDCSALVWKAYKQYANINFGSSGYPGTTATESAWCKSHKRVLNGKFKLSMVTKMTLRPGDIVFKSNSKKNKYSTTYHVEMITGYTCTYVDSEGNPTIAVRWGARSSGYEYGISDGYIVARPVKY